MKHVSQRTFDSYGIIFSLGAGGLYEFLSDIVIRMPKGLLDSDFCGSSAGSRTDRL